MSRRDYPVTGEWEIWTRENRPGCTHCQKCGIEFGRREKFFLRETQVSWMRGDDEVEYFHERCKP